MTRHLRIVTAGALAAALAACGSNATTGPGLLLGEPSAVAVYHGFTSKDAGNGRHPYLAIAGSATNELTIVDAVDDSAVPAPVALRSLVIPSPGRPALLASADLGDGKPDLLVAVSAGDSRLQLVETWKVGGGVEPAPLDLGSDILAIVPLPSLTANTARVAAALAGRQVAVVTFERDTAGDGMAIVVASAPVSATFAFQPAALAAMPGDGTKLYAATLDAISGVEGVAELDVSGTPFLSRALDARAPTRLVAAARVREQIAGSTALDKTAFDLTPGSTVSRVYAILDESGCGPAAEIACGLVALDPATGQLVPDPAGEPGLAWQAPIPIPGAPLALGALLPPSIAPSAYASDPDYAGTLMRVQTAVATRATSGVAAVASTDGSVYFVDLGRWEKPSEQVVYSSVAATVGSPQGRVPTATGSAAVNQWLVLSVFDPVGITTTVFGHADAAGLSGAVTRTPGYTPTEHWTVTYQGSLPGLSTRRAEAAADGSLALQVAGTSGGTATEVVHLYDPTLGVRPGDTVVIDPAASDELRTRGCTAASFEAEVETLLTSSTERPGGAVQLRKKLDPAHPEWDACVDALAGGATGLRATFLAGGYVLTKGTGAAAVHVGRPEIGEPFSVAWAPELPGTCNLPPASPWPAPPAPACDATCRADCEKLVVARMARRIGYPEPCAEAPDPAACSKSWLTGTPAKPVTGPALGFQLALETALAPPRGLTLTIDTSDGRNPFHVAPPAGVPVDPRAVATFDRSPHNADAGVRVLVPYAGGVVLDATPTVSGGGRVAIQ